MSVQLPASEDLPPRLLAARQKVMIFTRLSWGLAVLGLVWLIYTGWFLLLALLALLLAIVFGITALCFMPRAQSKPFDYALLILLMLGCAFFALSAGVQLIFLDQTTAYADCISSALTQSRASQCTQQLEDSLLSKVLGQ